MICSLHAIKKINKINKNNNDGQENRVEKINILLSVLKHFFRKGLIIAPGQVANGYNLGMSFRSSINNTADSRYLELAYLE